MKVFPVPKVGLIAFRVAADFASAVESLIAPSIRRRATDFRLSRIKQRCGHPVQVSQSLFFSVVFFPRHD